MNKKYFIYIIILIITIIIIEIIRKTYNNLSINNTKFKEEFTLKTEPLNLVEKEEIILKSIQPEELFYISIESDNLSDIDYRIAKYFTNNIIPANIFINNNLDAINKVSNGEIDLAFVREQILIDNIINSKNNIDYSNIRVIMPTFNKYILCLTSIFNDIQYLEEIVDEELFRYNNTINICYINDENLDIIKIIISLLDIKVIKPKIIKYKKISSFNDLGDKDIYLGLVYINPNLQKQIDEFKLKPIFFTPKNKLPRIENRFIHINREDVDLQKEFHYNLKERYGWILESFIYPTMSSTRYRTYKFRFLLITNKNNKKFSKGNKQNFRTFINNWYEHLLLLRNIYQVSPNNLRNYPTISEQFTDFAVLDRKLKFYDEMKLFLKNKKLLDY